jgi:glycosyltransferase involved in cell wall biosynthesis
MPASPKVSVLIPTYNYARYLPLAIESVLNQDFTDFELIIQDDCSMDNTAEAVERYLSDRRLIFETNERNLGLSGNWNLCLSKARGEYIKFVFGDDMLASPECLSRMVSVLDSDRSVSLVASSRKLIDSESRFVNVVSEFGECITADGPEIISLCLLKLANYVGEPSAVMFRKADSGRGFSPRYSQLIDLEMWFHLLEQGRFCFIDEPLASFRIHPQQKTIENVRNQFHLSDPILLLRDYIWRSYIPIGRALKYYFIIDAVYNRFWRPKKKRLVDRKTALKGIRACLPVPGFFLVYPLYKSVKPFFKLYIKATGWPAKKLRPSFLPLMERGSVFPDLSGDESLRPRSN